MNKGELVDAIAQKTNVTKKQADIVVTAMLSLFCYYGRSKIKEKVL